MIRYLKTAIILPCLMLMGAGFKYGGIKHDITVTAKSGATTTLTASSSQVQSFTGTSAETVDLPSGLTVSNGYWYAVNNEGATGSVVVRDASASVLATISASQSSIFYMKDSLVVGGNWSVVPGAGAGSGGGGGGSTMFSAYIDNGSGGGCGGTCTVSKTKGTTYISSASRVSEGRIQINFSGIPSEPNCSATGADVAGDDNCFVIDYNGTTSMSVWALSCNSGALADSRAEFKILCQVD